MEPTEKAPAIEQFLEAMAGRTTAIEGDHCVREPIGCGRPVLPEVEADYDHVDAPDMARHGFRDGRSLSEYRISGLCQVCQDDVFGN